MDYQQLVEARALNKRPIHEAEKMSAYQRNASDAKGSRTDRRAAANAKNDKEARAAVDHHHAGISNALKQLQKHVDAMKGNPHVNWSHAGSLASTHQHLLDALTHYTGKEQRAPEYKGKK